MSSSPSILNEKDPLLPLNRDDKIDSLKGQNQKRRLFRSFIGQIAHTAIFCLALYCILKCMTNSPTGKDEATMSAVNDMTHKEQKSFQQLQTQARQEFTYQNCYDRPTIPLEGDVIIPVDNSLFHRLSISQRSSDVGRNPIQFMKGKTTVHKNDDVANTTVTITIKGTNEDITDAFWIEQIENVEDEEYKIVIHQENNHVPNACVVIDVDVAIPNTDSLAAFSIQMPSNTVTIAQDLQFSEGIDISTANGNIMFEKGIVCGKAIFKTANGHIAGTFKSLSDGLDISMANGDAAVRVQEISKKTEGAAISIKGASANGSIKLYLPSDFNSRFSLSGISGSRMVKASNPKLIHYDRWSWGTLKGYYGDDKNVKDHVTLSNVNGKLLLSYQNDVSNRSSYIKQFRSALKI